MSTQVTSGVRGGFAPLQPVPFAEDDLNMSELSSFLRRHRRLFVVSLCVGVLVATTIAFVWPKHYTSSASFIPQGQSRLSSLATLASQFGVAVPVTDAGRTPAFYAALLESKNLLAEVVQQRFAGASGDTVALVGYLRGQGSTTDLRIQSAITKLARKMTVAVDQKAGLVRVEVTLGDPRMSRDVTRALIAQVDSFNLKSRQSQASAERRFSERRLAEAQAEARQAQDELQSFLQRNRDFKSSPQLSFTYDRLADNVSLRQQIYTSVAQSYEQARIEEVRDTPVITVVEAPMLPARADTRPFVRAIAAGVLLALVAARLIGVRQDRRAPAEV